MQEYLISILIFLPLCAAFAAVFVPAHSIAVLRWLSLGTSVIQLVVFVMTVPGYEPSGGLQFVEQQPWITLSLGSWGTFRAQYFVGLDGLSLPLVGLTLLILALANVSSWNIARNAKGYFILMLVLNASIVGTFAALDLLLFYLCFEFMLLPMFFLIALWGGERREYASIKFFLYTLFGSVLILVAMIALYISVHEPGQTAGFIHSFNIVNMTDPTRFISNSILDPNNPWQIGWFDARQWAFLLLFIGFSVKLPMAPFHTWLPDAHVEAPTPVSVVLAALLLKIGGYGFARIAFPIFPEAALHFSMFIGIMGVISIVYGALNAMACKDLKKMIAYSSVSHMGFVLLGLASATPEGVSGAVYMMISHGILSAMLFLLVGVLYDRTHDRTIAFYSGLSGQMKTYTAFVIIGFFASMGLPGFSGFIAEVMVFLGAFKAPGASGVLHESLAIIATSGLILSAAYFLWTLQRMFFGPLHVKGGIDVRSLTDLTPREYVLLVPLAALALALGLAPQPLIDVIDPFARQFSELLLAARERTTLIP